jgi:hypothetical protein
MAASPHNVLPDRNERCEVVGEHAFVTLLRHPSAFPHSTLFTLHPKPHPHSTPFTPKPFCTLNPTPQTLSALYTLNPKPYLHSTPYTLHFFFTIKHGSLTPQCPLRQERAVRGGGRARLRHPTLLLLDYSRTLDSHSVCHTLTHLPSTPGMSGAWWWASTHLLSPTSSSSLLLSSLELSDTKVYAP